MNCLLLLLSLFQETQRTLLFLLCRCRGLTAGIVFVFRRVKVADVGIFIGWNGSLEGYASGFGSRLVLLACLHLRFLQRIFWHFVTIFFRCVVTCFCNTYCWMNLVKYLIMMKILVKKKDCFFITLLNWKYFFFQN